MSPVRSTRAVGVILPVHDEQEHLDAALTALSHALCHPALVHVSRRVAVVLDSCRDGSRAIADRWLAGSHDAEVPFQAAIVDVDATNVGVARHAGAAHLLAGWAIVDPARIWLATTDADSRVPPDWLARQVAHHDRGVGIWTGTIDVTDWSERTPAVAAAWHANNLAESRPLHGASMGLNASAYLQVGGFSPLATGEDRALHRAVTGIGIRSIHDAGVPVLTSSRRTARAPLGFAHALDELDERPATPPVPA